MSRIEIVIHHDGSVDLELSEFYNRSCLDTTRAIESLLGNDIQHRRVYSSQLSETLPQATESTTNNSATIP